MESTNMTDRSRLETILELITIAFFRVYLTGDWLIEKVSTQLASVVHKSSHNFPQNLDMP